MPDDKAMDAVQRRDAVIKHLIDRLAVAMTCLQAVDDTVDIFHDLERGKAMLISKTVNKARIEVFRGTDYSNSRADTSEMLLNDREKIPAEPRLTPAYAECKRAIEINARKIWDGR